MSRKPDPESPAEKGLYLVRSRPSMAAMLSRMSIEPGSEDEANLKAAVAIGLIREGVQGWWEPAQPDPGFLAVVRHLFG